MHFHVVAITITDRIFLSSNPQFISSNKQCTNITYIILSEWDNQLMFLTRPRYAAPQSQKKALHMGNSTGFLQYI